MPGPLPSRGPVHGLPAVATVTMGGNDVLAWEVAPKDNRLARLQRRAESGPHRQRAAGTGQPRASAAAVMGERIARSATTSDNWRLVTAVRRAGPDLP
jgi:hypothetical protein